MPDLEEHASEIADPGLLQTCPPGLGADLMNRLIPVAEHARRIFRRVGTLAPRDAENVEVRLDLISAVLTSGGYSGILTLRRQARSQRRKIAEAAQDLLSAAEELNVPVAPQEER